jgi:hypothetical protein
MVKFILVLKVCYAVAQFCAPPFQYSETFDSFRDCAITGYKHAYEMIQVFPAEEVEKTQTIIKFYCYPQPETPATPSKLKGKPV